MFRERKREHKRTQCKSTTNTQRSERTRIQPRQSTSRSHRVPVMNKYYSHVILFRIQHVRSTCNEITTITDHQRWCIVSTVSIAFWLGTKTPIDLVTQCQRIQKFLLIKITVTNRSSLCTLTIVLLSALLRFLELLDPSRKVAIFNARTCVCVLNLAYELQENERIYNYVRFASSNAKSHASHCAAILGFQNMSVFFVKSSLERFAAMMVDLRDRLLPY